MNLVKRLLIIIVLGFGVVTKPAMAVLPEGWFCPSDPTKPSYLYSIDNANLFKEAYFSQWSSGASKIKVVKLYTGHVARMTDLQLTEVINFLNNHNMKLALEWPALTWPMDGTNAGRIEGFAYPNHASVVAGRIKRLGGVVSYLDLDEPLYFGHYFTGLNSTQYSIKQLAENAAVSLKQFQLTFPDVKIGSTEPLDVLPLDFQAGLTEWMNEYETVMGRPFDFFHIDLNWSNLNKVPAINSFLAQRNIPMGVIFNSAMDSALITTNNLEWMDNAKLNIQRYNALGLGQPAHALIQNWSNYPTISLPETSNSAYTNLINYYYSPMALTAPRVFKRFYNPTTYRHFYTANPAEAANLTSWREELSLSYIFPTQGGAVGLIPLYRFYKASLQDHFFTTSRDEANAALADGYISENVAGYVFASPNNLTVPVYRAYHSLYGYFYTKSESEYLGLSSVWRKDGIKFYTRKI